MCKQDLKNAFFSAIAEYNQTILGSYNKEGKKLMIYEEKRGIFYNSLKRHLGGKYGGYYINYRWFPVTDLQPWFREDGTIGNFRVKVCPRTHYSWMEDGITHELKMGLHKLAEEHQNLGRTTEQLLLCDIVNSVKFKI